MANGGDRVAGQRLSPHARRELAVLQVDRLGGAQAGPASGLVQVQDLAIDAIRELLVEAGADVSPEQAEQLATFIVQAGGVERALAALSQMHQAREAA